MNQTPSLDDKVNGLKDMCVFLMNRVTDLAVQIEAMRVLLDRHRIYSHDEYQHEQAEARARWDAQRESSLAAVGDAALRRLLESFEGTKQ